MRASLRAGLVVVGVHALVACGGGARPTAAPAEPHPLVHRFRSPEEWAKVFDDPARDAWQKPASVVALANVTPKSVVADLGAGTGYFEPWLSRAVGDGGKVLALDVEPGMIRYLRQRIERDHLDNVEPRLVGVDDPDLGEASVDRVLIVDTWHHVPKRVAYAGKLRHALRPGGSVIVVDFTRESSFGPPPEHRLPAEAVRDELVAGGLHARIVDEDLPEQYVVVARID